MCACPLFCITRGPFLLSIYLSVLLPACLLPICQSVCLSVCLYVVPVCLSICLHVWLSQPVCLSVHLDSKDVSVLVDVQNLLKLRQKNPPKSQAGRNPPICLSSFTSCRVKIYGKYLFFCLLPICESVFLSLCLYVVPATLSICLPFWLSVCQSV